MLVALGGTPVPPVLMPSEMRPIRVIFKGWANANIRIDEYSFVRIC
jgi:hypothetical protein